MEVMTLCITFAAPSTVASFQNSSVVTAEKLERVTPAANGCYQVRIKDYLFMDGRRAHSWDALCVLIADMDILDIDLNIVQNLRVNLLKYALLANWVPYSKEHTPLSLVRAT